MPAPINLSERFVSQCSPVLSSNYDTCGTVTRATIAHLKRTDLEALFRPGGLFADLDAWFKHSVEMKACGVQRYGMYDWIMANADRTQYRAALKQNVQPGVRTASLLQPFIFGRQDSVINKDHWKVTNGWQWDSGGAGDYETLNSDASLYPITDAVATAAGVAASDRVIRVESNYSIPMDPNWFRERDRLHIFNTSNGVYRHGQWRVLASASSADLKFAHVLVRSENAGSTEPYDSGPTSGYLIPGLNNVNDYERWCQNLPTIDPRKRVPFWFQTWRDSRCVDSEYRAVYARLNESNAAWREFGDLPLAERNRQDEHEAQRRFVNAFFYNKPISELQTLDSWESLEAINTPAGAVIDPGLSGKIIGRRANFKGVVQQLLECGRVFDLLGDPLNFYEWLDLNYDIKRARESQGRTVTDIDWWTNSTFASNLMTAFLQYYKNEYLDQLRIMMKVDEMNDLGMVYNSYRVKRPGGVRINVLVDNFWDDRLNEFDRLGMTSAGNELVAVDIGAPGPSGGTIYWAQLAANRQTHTTADLEQLARFDATYRCVMNVISIEQRLTSSTGLAVVECPLNSAWIRNLSINVPVTTGKSGATYVDLYNR